MSSHTREHFRYSVPAEEQQAILVIDGTEVPVRLFEQSFGGFSVCTNDRVKVAVGNDATLITPAAGYTTRVCSVVEEDRGIRLGLKQLDELPLDHENLVAYRDNERSFQWLFNSLTGGEGLRLFTWSMFCRSLETACKSGIQHLGRQFQNHASLWAFIATVLVAFVGCSLYFWTSDPGNNTIEVSKKLRLTGIVSLSSGDVLDLLAATDQQQREIRIISKETLASLDDLVQGETGENLAMDISNLLEEAHERIDAVLTDEQRQRWDSHRIMDR